MDDTLLVIAAGVCAAAGAGLLLDPAERLRKRRQRINDSTDTMAAIHIDGMRPRDTDEPFTRPVTAVITDMPPENVHQECLIHDQPVDWCDHPDLPVYTMPDAGDPGPVTWEPPAYAEEAVARYTSSYPWTDHDTDAWISQMQYEMHRFMVRLIGASELDAAEKDVARAGGPKAILGGDWSA